jgi:hypothetical protein
MEKFLAGLLMAALMLAAVTPASARDTKYLLPIAAALETKDAKEKLDGSVKFFFRQSREPEDPYQARHRCNQSQN